jgi:small GTP-binding protein
MSILKKELDIINFINYNPILDSRSEMLTVSFLIEKMFHDSSFKIIIVGESDVGKTSVIESHDRTVPFEEDYSISTIGVSFKEISIDETVLQIWDTAGQERFQSITPAFYRGSHAIVVCFDLTNRMSFKKVEKWMKSISDHNEKEKCHLILLVGNKCDKESIIEKSEIDELIEKHQTKYFQTSAKTKEGISELFRFVAKTLETRAKETNETLTSFRIDITSNDLHTKTESKSCCH